MKFVEIYLDQKSLPDTFTCGFLTLKNMSQLPLDHIGWVLFDKGHISLAVFGKTESKEDVALMNIEMFQLAIAPKAFANKSAFWQDGRKKWVKLPEGTKFEPSMLALKHCPADWTVDGFGKSGRCIVHIYTSVRHALIIRFLLSTGPLLTSPFLNHAIENFHINEQRWITTPPRAVARDLPPAAKDKPLGDSIAKEVVGAIQRGRSFLKLKGKPKPAVVQQAIYDALNATLPKGKAGDLAIDIGCLWGQTLCDALDWEWAEVTFPSGDQYFAVVSPDRAFLVAPMHYMQQQLQTQAKKGDVTTLLLFNMIKAGNLPESRPSGYQMLR